MQATLGGYKTESRVEASEVLGQAVAFRVISHGNNVSANRDHGFKAKNPFAAPSRDNGNANDRALIEAIINSKIYQDYERAFSETTGLSLILQPVVAKEAQTIAGICTNAVPVRIGDRVIGFLQTQKPTPNQFERTAKLTGEWDVEAERSELQEACFSTRVVSQKQHNSVIQLLSIFAQHLSLLSNQMVVQQENSEPPVITRAKEYIHEHQTEEISLGQVAKAVNTSTFYFCKMFKKVTGINFTDYLSRVRIEKSKNLLLNPNLRVSEIAFEVGFQSLTHFNRVFKRILGQSPTEYRSQLVGR